MTKPSGFVGCLLTCEGQNIKYRTCSNVDCPPESGDFRSQQCSAHADVRHQGQFHEWLPVDNDPDNPCALKCRAKGSGQVVELAPKVLDGTRCYTESLDMCISGVCQIVGCDLELGSTAKEDNCGVCNGDGSSCRLVRGHYKSQHASGKTEDTVVVIPFGSRHVRLVLKGSDHLSLESKTLQGVKGQLSLDATRHYVLENTTVDFQQLTDKEVLRIAGPLGADFTVKVSNTHTADSVVQYIFYQPIVHRWRETDFFPCSVTCGGGYQLTSAECFDLRSNRMVVDQYCHYYPENIKPKPKLQECNMDLCPESGGYKQIMPYDLYHPLPRWESSPWTSCSTSCGGGVQSRAVTCVEEDMQGTIVPSEEWKCLYATKTPILQPCNNFDCPTWLAQEWSPCTVTCGQGLSYRVVLCIDHRGLHAGGCSPTTKPHIKEECLVPVPCYKPLEKLPVEAKPPWSKQAQELDSETAVTEEPTFIPSPWGACSRACGAGTQRRAVRCQVLLSFSQAVADLPDDECEGPRPSETQPCFLTPCPGAREEEEEWAREREREKEERAEEEKEELYDWEYDGFTDCSETCGGGMQEAVVICLNKQTREASEEKLCVESRRPPQLVQTCNKEACPPRWEMSLWSSCSATCGVGLRTRAVTCTLRPARGSNRTEALRDEECRPPKPIPVQACNRFDCHPTWEPRDWGQCSRTCGVGAQKREVLCKQRLADGSILELPDTFCPSPTPPTLQACARIACPPRWVPTDWTQRQLVVCRRQGESGQYQTLLPDACSSVPRPGTVRPCANEPCKSPPVKPSVSRAEPSILAQRKVYIQWRKGRKLHFLVGGYAYLLPWTSVVIRCPTRRVRKGHIRWLKDGRPLGGASSTRLTVSPMGYIRVQQVQVSDAGVYTCVAGQAQESFVLKVIGSKRKLAVPQGNLWLPANGDHDDDDHNDAGREKKNTQLAGGASSSTATMMAAATVVSEEKAREMRASLGRYDALVQRLLEALDEALRNLSGGQHKDSVLAQLFGELTPHSHNGENNESALQHLHPPEEPDQNSETSTHTHTLQQQQLLRRTASFSTGPLRKPTLHVPHRTAGSGSGTAAASTPLEPVAYVGGGPVLVPRRAIRLRLKCQAQGNPEPVLTWTKDGHELQASSRVGLLPDGSLLIRSPADADAGLYTCSAHNHIGSASLSSTLHITDTSCGDDATAGNSSLCLNASRGSQPCHGQHCPQRWLPSAWSACSAPCGGGVQTRRVSCQGGAEGDMRCRGAGKRPPLSQSCNTQPCSHWASTAWGPCHGHCVGLRQATQHRHVFCQDRNGTRVSHRMCGALPRLPSQRNCTSQACSIQWRMGPWTQCTTTCGRHGFQSRYVACAHSRTGKLAREIHCSWRPRPASWQRCNVQSCGRAGECRDSTRYCEKVRQLELCPLAQFKSRCCQSCRNT
ncbi:ADAMTS-like protein 1 [Sardina pilchardus]|uniref:ADAMTS-like protein 1 n=1 Tax=Sardina pilchardus TaxID=27697 RepID=UPI002E112C69